MFVADCYDINTAGNLTIGGMDAVKLAHDFGTPLYVMDEETIRNNCRIYKNAIDKFYDGQGRILYASKAFSAKEIYRIVKEEGLGVDVVSGGELFTALAAGTTPELIYFHGNNKTPDEIALGLDHNIGYFVVDNSTELQILSKMAAEKGKTAQVLFRIKPGIDAHTHSFIRTGQIDSKFGVALETGEAMAIMKEALALPSLHVAGVHCHIGSQIFELEPFRQAAQVMIGFMGQVKRETGHVLKELNLGGGFGIKYTAKDRPIEYDKYIEAVSMVVKESAQRENIPQPFIVMEPGRSIVASAGTTLYTVGAVKNIPNIRTYVSVDGSMCDNPRYILYASEYEGIIANKAAKEKEEIVTVAGKCCESGDIIMRDVSMQKAQSGDIMAVFATGAYNYSMASNYNRLPKPAVVMIKDEQARVIVKRETYDDLLRNDL